jgi:hypothetical protein
MYHRHFKGEQGDLSTDGREGWRPSHPTGAEREMYAQVGTHRYRAIQLPRVLH